MLEFTIEAVYFINKFKLSTKSIIKQFELINLIKVVFKPVYKKIFIEYHDTYIKVYQQHNYSFEQKGFVKMNCSYIYKYMPINIIICLFLSCVYTTL